MKKYRQRLARDGGCHKRRREKFLALQKQRQEILARQEKRRAATAS